MKGKKLFYIALLCSLIVILYGCSGRNSRAYLEDRIGNQISRVYPTKNLEDLFEQFPNGFLIEQSYLFEDRIIDLELEGIEKGKPLEGTIKSIAKVELRPRKFQSSIMRENSCMTMKKRQENFYQ